MNYWEDAREFIEFSKKDVESLIEAFKLFDADGSGSISFEELVNAFKAMGHGASKEEIQQLFVEIDRDGSGAIEWREFLQMMRMLYPHKKVELRKEFYEPAVLYPEFTKEDITVFIMIFREFDEDSSGSISAAELDKAFKSMGQGCTPEDIQQIINTVDADNSGEIEWTEFLHVMRILYPEKRAIFERKYYEPAKSFIEFTREDIDAFITVFREFDVDGSSSISASELNAMFKAMGQGVAPDETQALIDAVDTDGSGEIEWTEFLQLCKLLYPEKQRALQREFYDKANFPEFSRTEINTFIELFRTFDEDASGSIDAGELATMLRYMGQGSSLQEAAELVEAVDVDESGVLDFSEFLQVMRLLYPDRQRDVSRNLLRPAFIHYQEFTRPEIEVFLTAFKKFDKDGSGGIDVAELEEALRELGQGFTREEVQVILESVDADKSGEIEWLEFLEINRKFYQQKLIDFEKNFLDVGKEFSEFRPEDIRAFAAAFREFDVDGSESIDVDELGPLLAALGQGYNSSELQTILDNVDEDKSGDMQWREFLQIMRALYAGKSLTKKDSKQEQPQVKAAAQPQAPAKASFQPAAPKATSYVAPAKPIGTSSGFGAHRDMPKCVTCGKTVYPIESLKIDDQVWHKGCFRCQAPNCVASLNLKNFKRVQGTIYCQKHVPKTKPHQVAVKDSLLAMSAAAAPKAYKMPSVERTRRNTFSD